MERQRFLELLKLPSRENFNQPIHEFIKRNLEELGITYSIYEGTTIYNIDDPTLPLFSAHTDTVRSKGCDGRAEFNVEMFDSEPTETGEVFTIFRNRKAVLGGDDMCGVFIILEMLRAGKRFNFIFSDGEETVIAASAKTFVREFKKELSVLPFGIILDRKGNTDIICANNRYGHPDFEAALHNVGKQFGYFPSTGMCSDADFIRNVMSCANLSSGYYGAHSYKEFVVWQHMENAYNYAVAILDTLHEKFPVHPAILTRYFEDSIINNLFNTLEASGVLSYR